MLQQFTSKKGARTCEVLVIAFYIMAVSHLSAAWTVMPRGSFALNSGSLTAIRELSGVTYLGQTESGLERFAAVQDVNNRVVMIDLSFSDNGTILTASAVDELSLNVSADYEGIAFTGAARNRVYVSEETSPGVHEHSLETGARLQTVPLPSVYEMDRGNRGFESLTRSANGTMWTANEEALVPDGPASTPLAGSVVRLQQLVDDNESVVAGPAFAYLADAIHAGSGGSNDRSGVADLVGLPDGSLLTLERSAAIAFPVFRSRIYEVDWSTATDISSGEFAEGLIGESYVPAQKSLLWSGQAGTFINGNLEGLTLGPRLANGKWTLVGVIDNDGSGDNLIVSFELASTSCAMMGDYTCDGTVNTDDFVLWTETFGASQLAADGNLDGLVDAADYVIWRKNAEVGGGQLFDPVPIVIPEPASGMLLMLGSLVIAGKRRRAL
jgi:hypothetical protein